MRLNTKVRYATRAMLELAARYEAGPISLAEVAESQEISLKYLESLLGLLRAAGLVRGRRGAGGGYVLARPPEEITLREVYEAVEGRGALVPCTLDSSACRRAPECVTQEVWAELYEAAMAVLERRTLADLVERAEARTGPTPRYEI